MTMPGDLETLAETARAEGALRAALVSAKKLVTDAEAELAILPGVGHFIPPLKVQISIDFLRRHAAPQPAAGPA